MRVIGLPAILAVLAAVLTAAPRVSWTEFRPRNFPRKFPLHEPQHAGHDPSFSYNIWCAKFYLRHTGFLSPGFRPAHGIR